MGPRRVAWSPGLGPEGFCGFPRKPRGLAGTRVAFEGQRELAGVLRVVHSTTGSQDDEHPERGGCDLQTEPGRVAGHAATTGWLLRTSIRTRGQHARRLQMGSAGAAVTMGTRTGTPPAGGAGAAQRQQERA
jgi:hypothetical protein